MKALPSPSIWKCRWRLLEASLRGLLLHQQLHAFSYHCRCLSIRFCMWHLGFRCPSSRTRSKHNRCRLRLMLWHTRKVLPVTPVPQLHTKTATSPTLPKGWSTLQRVQWALMHLRPRSTVVQAAKAVAEGGEVVAARAKGPDTCVAKAEVPARAAEAAAGRTDPVDGQSP